MLKRLHTGLNFNFGVVDSVIISFNIIRSKFFFTVCDLNFKPIVTFSSGLAGLGNSKRKKFSIQCLESLITKIKVILVKYKIKNFVLLLYTKRLNFLYLFLIKLQNFGFICMFILARLRVPHCIVRKRKKRRV